MNEILELQSGQVSFISGLMAGFSLSVAVLDQVGQQVKYPWLQRFYPVSIFKQIVPGV